ncbi:MAG: Na+/H+ antiporter NhaA [Alphaproteobacteria bacterium]|nr:Na+/H+ antiporter NhaA [Alphaproteobacteria bacterium]
MSNDRGTGRAPGLGRFTDVVRDFMQMEASGGILLVVATVLAMVLANTGFGPLYTAFLETKGAIRIGALEIAKPLLLWINDGLMAVFFFLVGLEMKREFVIGELSSPARVARAGIAAIGGVAVPALIYYYINSHSPENIGGWAIPAATDIAFALAVLSLLGNRVPISVKVLLLAIAIFDDLGAILIIAFFYTNELSTTTLMMAIVPVTGLIVANRMGVTRAAPYIVMGLVLWVLVLKSGVHATLAGVITALAIPLSKREGSDSTLLEDLEHGLHRWVAFAILPLFAFANAGVSFTGIGVESFVEPVKLGISMGLFVGKQLGIFVLLWLTISLKLAPMPQNANWLHLYGVSILGGVGFTMSLFIGSLAFEHSDFEAPIRLGVLAGSLLSAAFGYLVLRIACARDERNNKGEG